MASVRQASSGELLPHEVGSLRSLMDAAWPDPDDAFTDDDWDHAVGGVHFLVEDEGRIVSHASVVPRELHVGSLRVETGYVEAVATLPTHRGRGHASAAMRGASRYIDRTYELGALGTGDVAFYERLGWIAWRGPTFVRTEGGLVRTPEDDGFVLVRRTPKSPPLDLSAPLSCEWRPGDVW